MRRWSRETPGFAFPQSTCGKIAAFSRTSALQSLPWVPKPAGCRAVSTWPAISAPGRCFCSDPGRPARPRGSSNASRMRRGSTCCTAKCFAALAGPRQAPRRAGARRKPVSHAMLHFFGVGVANVLGDVTHIAAGSPTFGPALEQLVFCELRAWLASMPATRGRSASGAPRTDPRSISSWATRSASRSRRRERSSAGYGVPASALERRVARRLTHRRSESARN